MKNAKKLDEKEILRRAKVLYFDVMPSLQFIFADEYGRFSYNQQSLLEQNRYPEGTVYRINRDGIAQGDPEEEAESKEAQIEKLKAEYKELKGEDAPKNWGIPKLTTEIEALKNN